MPSTLEPDLDHASVGSYREPFFTPAVTQRVFVLFGYLSAMESMRLEGNGF